ncbi:MAG TPA: ABC transporter substrate-binding protein [Candidatus Binatia bacterium]|nr:ABC transporter substrate-binding protein [Candidatus Binatia bacterium]
MTLLAVAVLAVAQQPTKIPRIGYISGTGNEANQGPYVEALRQGLRDLGHVEGKTFVIEYRGAEGQIERVPSLVEELVKLKVDLLVAPVPVAIRTAKQATITIPIVTVSGIDPVASGAVESLARPGGNLTGISTLAQDLNGKRLELLKEVVPQLSRVGILLDRGTPTSVANLKEYDDASKVLKIEIQSLEVDGPKPDLESVFKTAAKLRIGGLVTITNANILMQQKRLAELAIKNRFPSLFQGSTWVDAGGLMSYSTDEIGAFRRAATYVDKILKGAKPADLPVEQTTKFELVINLRTAKQISLNIPQWVLVKADRVIR